MSLCFRTISHKFTSLVNTRKQVTKVDRQLLKNVKTSTFLDEFLGLQASVDTKTNLPDRNLEVLADIDLSYQNRLPIPIKSHMKWEKPLAKSYMKDKNKILHAKQLNLMDHYKYKNVDQILITNLPLYNVITKCKEKEDKFLTRKIAFNVNNDVNNSMYNNRYFFNKTISSATVNTNKIPNATSLTTGAIKVQEDKSLKPVQNNKDRPSRAQLEHVFKNLSHNLPNIFSKTIDYTIYAEDLIFVNNIKGTTTKGIVSYIKQVAFLRTLSHLKFAWVKLQILKITIDPEDDSIKVRWQVHGITGLKAFFNIWRIKLWNLKDAMNNADIWYDGFSTYYVGANGLIFKHVLDKVIPDQNQLYHKEKEPVVTKLAMCTRLEDLQILSSNEFISKLKNAIMFNVK